MGVSNGYVLDQLEPFSEISVPKFLASGKSFEGSLVNDKALLEWGIGMSN